MKSFRDEKFDFLSETAENKGKMFMQPIKGKIIFHCDEFNKDMYKKKFFSQRWTTSHR